MVYLVWAVFGGFLLHIILCNYLKVLLKPHKEVPVDSTKDIIKRNITPWGYTGWGLSAYDHFKNTSHFGPEYQELLQKIQIPKPGEEWRGIVGRVFNLSKSEAWLGYGPGERWWLRRNNLDGRFKQFWISKESIPLSEHPYAFYLTNKKWPLLEVSLIFLIILYLSLIIGYVMYV